MRLLPAVAVFCLSLLAVGIAAKADEFVIDTQSDVVIEAPGGQYEDKTYELTPSGPTALRARVKVGNFGRHERWQPAFTFGVSNGDTTVAFQVARRYGDHPKLVAWMRRTDRKQYTHTKKFAFVPFRDKPFMVQMAWTPSGKVTAWILAADANEQHELELGFPPEKLTIAASTGRMEVTPLELGHLK